MKIKPILFAATALLTCNAALAGGFAPQATPTSLSNGFYAEPYFGYGYVNALHNAVRRNGISGGLAVGYKLNDNWAMDSGYTQLPHANVSTYYFYASLKFIFPINSGWDVFAKLGPAYARGSRDRTLNAADEMVLFTGAGATFWINQNVGFVFQGAFTTKSSNMPATFNLTGGLNYFF